MSYAPTQWDKTVLNSIVVVQLCKVNNDSYLFCILLRLGGQLNDGVYRTVDQQWICSVVCYLFCILFMQPDFMKRSFAHTSNLSTLMINSLRLLTQNLVSCKHQHSLIDGVLCVSQQLDYGLSRP